MSATYLVEVVTFDDLRPGDRVLHQGAPVTIAAVGKEIGHDQARRQFHGHRVRLP